MGTDLAIEAIGLAKSYGDTRVLAGVDLRVRRGSVFALLGPNGAGKTTTVRILSTLTRPDGGRAMVAGYDVVRERHRVRRAISLTGQYAALDEPQTGAENLRMMARLSGLSRAAAGRRAKELLDLFDLTEAADRRVATYSGGMRRRLDLAASLVGEPAVIFLDEPTTGLDPAARVEMWRVIAGLVDTGVTVFLTTQYLEEADQLADNIAVIDGGRVVAEGSPVELKRLVSAQRLEIELVDADAFDQVARHLGDRALGADPTRRIVEVATDGDGGGEIRDLLDQIDPTRRAVVRFAVREASLDDVFLTLTGPSTGQSEKETINV